MNRPYYESLQDRITEEGIIGKFCESMSSEGMTFTFQKLKPSLIIDYALILNGKVYAFVEVKRRNLRHDQIPEIILSLHKYKELLSYERIGFRSLLVFGFDDGLFYTDTHNISTKKVTMCGRKDRGDEHDIEPVVWIPHTVWHKVGQYNEEMEKCG